MRASDMRKPKHVPTMRERFDAKWKPDPITGCWVWTAGKFDSGAGAFRKTPHSTDQAHRVSYEIHIGPIGDECVLHTCENAACVNPSHLFTGSMQDRSDNSVAKDRHAYGERNGRTDMTERDVSAARAAYASGVGITELASKHGVERSAMWRAITGRTWGSVPCAAVVHNPSAPKLDAASVDAIRADRASGMVLSKIAKKHGISTGYAHRIVTGVARRT